MNFYYHLGRLAGFLIKPLLESYRYQLHFEKQSDASLIFPTSGKTQPIIYATFHQHVLALMPRFMHKQIVGIVSNSKDGSLMRGASEYWGYLAARGSSHRGGNDAFHEALNKLLQGFSVSITVDGPKGPIYKVKHGAVTLAERSSAVIAPMSAKARSAHHFIRSWDKMYFPYPFSKIDIYVGEVKKYTVAELEEKLLHLNQF